MAPPIPLRDRLLGRPPSSIKQRKRSKSLTITTGIARPTAKKPKRSTSLPTTMITSVELRKDMLNVAAGGNIYERASSRRARQRLALAEEAQGAVPLGRQAQAQSNNNNKKHETVWERQAGQVIDPSSVPQKKASQKAMDWTDHEEFLESKRRLRLLNISQQALKMKQKSSSVAATTAAATAATNHQYHHRPTDSKQQKQQQQQNSRSQKAAAVPPPQKQPPHRAASGTVVVPARRRTFSAPRTEQETTKIIINNSNNKHVRRGSTGAMK